MTAYWSLRLRENSLSQCESYLGLLMYGFDNGVYAEVVRAQSRSICYNTLRMSTLLALKNSHSSPSPPCFSTGSGRTGVFIGLSLLLERMRCEGMVDVFIITRMLRTQRFDCVQTVDQYAFCYAATLEYLASFDHYTS